MVISCDNCCKKKAIVSWLARCTNSDTEALDLLLEQPNMDAELFVRIGLPLQPLFMQRVEEAIFGKDVVS